MKTKFLNYDLTIIGLIFTLIVGLGVYIESEYQRSVTIEKKLQAMEHAVDFYEKMKELYDYNSELANVVKSKEEEMEEIKKFSRLYKDLLSVKPYLRHLTLITCYSESRNNYDVIHTGKFDSTTTGICGVKTHWINIIPEITSENINSLYAGSLVLEYLLNQNNQNVRLALKAYKGSIVNENPVDYVMSLRSKYIHLKSKLASM